MLGLLNFAAVLQVQRSGAGVICYAKNSNFKMQLSEDFSILGT